MEDQNPSQPPSPFNLQKLKQLIKEIEYDPNKEYYALSVDFLTNPSKYHNALSSSLTNNINSQLFQGNSPYSSRLKQALRFGFHYVVIDSKILEQIEEVYNCSRIRVGRNQKYGQRWVIYKEVISYFFVSKQKLQTQQQSQNTKCKRIEVYPYNNIADIRLIILKNQGLPEFYRGKLWILPGQFPSNPSKLRQKIEEKNGLIPHSMLINDPEIFKLKRKFKLFHIIIQPQEQQIIPPLEVRCYSHSYKTSHYTCICRHERSYVCDKLCYDDNLKHNRRCIYVPKNQINLNGESATIKKEKKSERRMEPGLYNQRNMCFFNTIIQCLVHIGQLSKYFIAQNQSLQLNYWNSDGTFGQIAQQYGKFIRELHAEANDKCHMSLFMTVGRWNPSYVNKNQQDSHQFLIKMLDWLKEDLNENEVKPVYKHIDNGNKSQEQLALQTEAIHKARNYSIIQKLMEGVQRSVIKCSFCKFTSPTFDYFLTIQLPMARETRTQIPIKACDAFYVASLNEQKIKKLKLTFNQQQTIQGLKKQVRIAIIRALGYEFQFYKVTAETALLIKNDNLFGVLSMAEQKKQKQIIFCVEKYKIGQGIQTIPINLVFKGKVKGVLPFCRPLYLPKTMEVQVIYIKILAYIIKCKKTETMSSVQTYFHKFFETESFPFNLILTNQKAGAIQLNRKKQYKTCYFQPGSILIIQIRNNDEFDFTKLNTYSSVTVQPSKQLKKKTIITPPTIEDCLKLYCKKELIEDGKWQCSNCKIKRQASKTLQFKHLPNILILSINRFKQIYSSSSYTSEFFKNQSLIEFGPQLDMTKFTQSKEQQKYRLFAIANHIRIDESLKDVRQMDGHYYAYIRTEKGWLRFDDEDVMLTSQQKVMSNKNAYILFYQKIIKS